MKYWRGYNVNLHAWSTKWASVSNTEELRMYRRVIAISRASKVNNLDWAFFCDNNVTVCGKIHTEITLTKRLSHHDTVNKAHSDINVCTNERTTDHAPCKSPWRIPRFFIRCSTNTSPIRMVTIICSWPSFSIGNRRLIIISRSVSPAGSLRTHSKIKITAINCKNFVEYAERKIASKHYKPSQNSMNTWTVWFSTRRPNILTTPSWSRINGLNTSWLWNWLQWI